MSEKGLQRPCSRFQPLGRLPNKLPIRSWAFSMVFLARRLPFPFGSFAEQLTLNEPDALALFPRLPNRLPAGWGLWPKGNYGRLRQRRFSSETERSPKSPERAASRSAVVAKAPAQGRSDSDHRLRGKSLSVLKERIVEAWKKRQ